MLAHRTCLRYVLLALVLIGLNVRGSHAYGQGTFLEKLEAAVRERLAEPSQSNQPSSDSPAAEQVTEEELPSPQATATASGGTASNRPPATTSILEGGAPSLRPGDRPVPTPSTDSSRENNAPSAPRRIYLGLEAEEISGGGIGVRVTKVTDGSPAWKAGFRAGDRIAGINGFAIAGLDTMVERLGKTSPGETVKFLVNRNDRNMELVAVLMDAELASRIAGEPLATGANSSRLPGGANDLGSDDASPDSSPWLGVTVNDLSPEFRKQFGLTVFRGAAVTTVAANSPASKIGILAGDAIIAVAGTPIETARDLTLWMSSARPGQRVEVTYQRGTAARTAPLTLEVTPESRAANRAPLAESVRSRPNRSAGAPAGPVADAAGVAPMAPATSTPIQNQFPLQAPATSLPTEPQVADVVPNVIPTPAVPAVPESSTSEVFELRQEVARLRAELEKANQRLETTQNRLQKIIEGLGKE
ncbi:MAG: PDZ domain-containing protein [Pirellulaceae bacterium]|nr:PDZ domain-containing protein [Pirellulaceae bacterium]